MNDWRQQPHRRFNPLSGEWVMVSPHRTQRPWQGQVEKTAAVHRPSHDPGCYLCPGNERAGGKTNPNYSGTFVFTNDFSALLADTPAGERSDGELFRAESEQGICRVVCFSPRHDQTLGMMSREEIRLVVDAWVQEYEDLGQRPFIHYVQIFENRGEMMGCSNPHPHGQIWASSSVPNEISKEQTSQKGYYDTHGRTLLTDYLQKEQQGGNQWKEGERLVCENESFVAAVPFWAIWPYETIVIAKRPVASIDLLSTGERDDLADILRRVTARYDNLFQVSFPYSMGVHQKPTDGDPHPEWHFHVHFMPPLLRSATVRKFMVGYELLAMPQRDITPEFAAQRLRELPETALV